MQIFSKKNNIGITLSVAFLIVSAVICNTDILNSNTVSAQTDNSSKIAQFNEKLDEVQMKFKQLIENNNINVSSLTLPANVNISEAIQKINSSAIIEKISNAFKQALSESGISASNATDALKERYDRGDLTQLVQKFDSLRNNSSR